jgi:hypothetical protein
MLKVTIITKRYIIFIFLILVSFKTSAQKEDGSWKQKTGLSFEGQFLNKQTMSFGFGRHYLHGSSCVPPFFDAIELKNELYLNGPRPIYSPKLSIYTCRLLFYGGINLGYYTDFRINNYAFTPEIGIGYLYIYLVYGRNILFVTNDLKVNKNCLSLKIAFPINQGFFWRVKNS